jgi:hypothetical protein
MIERKSITITVSSAYYQDLSEFVCLLKTIQRCCSDGASRDFKLNVDGDGSADMKFDFGEIDTSGIYAQDYDKPLIFGIGE